MEKETPSGILQCRRQADELKTLVSSESVRIARSRNRVSGDFIKTLRREFGHFQSYLDSLDLPPEIASIGNEMRQETQELLNASEADPPSNNGHAAIKVSEEVGQSGEDKSETESKEEIPPWHDPEFRELLVLESFSRLLQAPLEQLNKDLRASASPIIGEREEMDLVNFTVCDQFVKVVQDSLNAAVAKSRTNEDLTVIKKQFVKTLGKKLVDLEQDAAKERPHAGVVPAFKKCAESLNTAVAALIQDFIEGQQDSGGKSIPLDARTLLLPGTAAFLERREEKGEAWEWSERDWHVFRKNFKFPEKGPELMQPLPDPTDSNLISAAQVVNYTIRAGLKDKDGRFVILLSDAKSQIGRLKAFHAERQVEAALPGVLQYAKDIYAECVLKSLLIAVRRSVEDKGQYRELPGKNMAYLIGKTDFQMSWIPTLRNEVGAAFDTLIADARTSPQELQLALLEHGVEKTSHTLHNLCCAVGKKFGVQSMGEVSPPDTTGLTKAIDDPRCIYPYAQSIDYEQPVDAILLVHRGDERDFPLLDEEKAFLRKALDNFFTQKKGTFVQRKSYDGLLLTLEEKGQPLTVAADHCNTAFHAGDTFRTPNGLLRDLALEILRDHPYTHEPTRQEKQIALEVISKRRSSDKATRNEIWDAINTRLYAGKGGRSKAFAKELIEVMYAEWLRSRPTEPEPAPVVETTLPSQAAEITTEEQAGDATLDQAQLETQVVIDERVEVPSEAISVDTPVELIEEAKELVEVPSLSVGENTSQSEQQATLEEHMEPELPKAVAEWQRLQRAKIECVLAFLPETSTLAGFEQEFRSLEGTIRHANDRAVKTHDALHEHATNIVRMARSRKRAVVIGDFEAFAADFARLNQFLNTLAVHGKAIEALSDASEACENLLERVDDVREHSREAKEFLAVTLPQITAGVSPVDLGLIDHDKANGNGGEGILRRLEALKRDIPPMHELCDTEHEFEDEDKRSQYAEEVSSTLQAMHGLFKRLTGSAYIAPVESATLLIASEEDAVAVQEQPPQETVGASEKASTLALSSVVQPKKEVIPHANQKELDAIRSMIDALDEQEREVAQKVLVILSAPGEAGYRGTGMKVGRLRKYLQGLFPDQQLPLGEGRGQKDELFACLEKIAELHETAKKARKEQEEGKKQKDWTNGKLRVDEKTLATATTPLVLSLNNHRNFVFTLTQLGQSFIQQRGMQMTGGQIALFQKVKEQEQALQFHREDRKDGS